MMEYQADHSYALDLQRHSQNPDLSRRDPGSGCVSGDPTRTNGLPDIPSSTTGGRVRPGLPTRVCTRGGCEVDKLLVLALISPIVDRRLELRGSVVVVVLGMRVIGWLVVLVEAVPGRLEGVLFDTG